MNELCYSRREVLRSSVGIAGLTLPTFLSARAQASANVDAKARSCIVIYCWGGVSHYEVLRFARPLRGLVPWLVERWAQRAEP